MTTKPKKRVIGTNIIAMLRNYPMSAHDAFAEAIDNVHDAGGDQTTIEIYQDRIVITDNANGLSDLNPLVDISKSVSASYGSKIGSFGLGTKLMQLYFGNDILFESVCGGIYRKERYNWRVVQKSGNIGEVWNSRPRSASSAPQEIRPNGTRITIRELGPKAKFGRYMEDIRDRLSYRYRPGLANGKRVTIIDRTRRGQPSTYELKSDLSALGVYNGMRFVDGEVTGIVDSEVKTLKFRIGFSDLKEYNKLLQGVHFSYLDRVVTKVSSIDRKQLPSKLFAEVTLLSDEWKKCLTPIKDDIVVMKEELCTAVYTILSEWIDMLNKIDEEFFIEEFSSIFNDQFSNVLIFKPRTADGDNATKPEYRPGDETETTGGGGNGPGPVKPKPREKNRIAVPDPENGTGDASIRRRRLSGFKLVRAAEELGPLTVATYAYDEASNVFIVKINEKKALIADCWVKPYKVNVIWGIAAAQVANWARELALTGKLGTTGSWLVDMLTNAGFRPNADDPDKLFDQVNCYIVDKFIGEARRRRLDVDVAAA